MEVVRNDSDPMEVVCNDSDPLKVDSLKVDPLKVLTLLTVVASVAGVERLTRSRAARNRTLRRIARCRTVAAPCTSRIGSYTISETAVLRVVGFEDPG